MPIAVSEKDHFAAMPPAHHVVDRPSTLDELTRLTFSLSLLPPPALNVKVHDLPHFCLNAQSVE
jgi:hypothetical protein